MVVAWSTRYMRGFSFRIAVTSSGGILYPTTRRSRSPSQRARCCSRASASSRVRASSCFFKSISELGPLLTSAAAFAPVERSLRPRVGLFAPLRDKVTSSARLVDLCWLLQTSFNHLVGEREQLVWNLEAERLRSLEVDGQLVLGRRLHLEQSESGDVAAR